MRRVLWLVPAVAVAAGCELDDVVVSTGDPAIIVHAIIRPDLLQQYVVVERGFTGDVLGFTGGEPIPLDVPQLPLRNAVVTIVNLDDPADPCGGAPFNQFPVGPPYYSVPGVYWGPPGCPSMAPGDRLELTVTTADGEVVTGRVLVPGLNGATLRLAGTSRAFGSDTLTFNRDHDTLGVVVEASAFRAMQVEVRRDRTPFDPGRSRLDVTLLTFVDSNAVNVAGDVKDLFIHGEGGDSFIPGRYMTLVVGVGDINYYDFVRSETNEFTGRGLLNRLVGGIGVFGAVSVTTHRLKVVADQEDPREGSYRLQGTLEGVAVDLSVDVYVHRPVPSTSFAAFAEGTWVARQPMGTEWVPLAVNGASLEGTFTDQDLVMRVPCPPPQNCLVQRYVLRGRANAPSFGITVWDSSGIQSRFVGHVTATRP